MNAAAASDAPTSEQLADQARSGDRQAFETLYERHAGAAWGVGLVISDDKLVSSNAVARSFADLLSGPVDAAAHDTFLAALLSQVRKEVLAHDGKAATGLPSLVAEAEAAGQVDDTARCFAELPEAWRTWLWLSSVEGIAAADLGAVYHLPTDEADQLAERARDALAKRIAERRSRAVAGAGTGSAAPGSREIDENLADDERADRAREALAKRIAERRSGAGAGSGSIRRRRVERGRRRPGRLAAPAHPAPSLRLGRDSLGGVGRAPHQCHDRRVQDVGRAAGHPLGGG